MSRVESYLLLPLLLLPPEPPAAVTAADVGVVTALPLVAVGVTIDIAGGATGIDGLSYGVNFTVEVVLLRASSSSSLSNDAGGE